MTTYHYANVEVRNIQNISWQLKLNLIWRRKMFLFKRIILPGLPPKIGVWYSLKICRYAPCGNMRNLEISGTAWALSHDSNFTENVLWKTFYEIPSSHHLIWSSFGQYMFVNMWMLESVGQTLLSCLFCTHISYLSFIRVIQQIVAWLADRNMDKISQRVIKYLPITDRLVSRPSEYLPLKKNLRKCMKNRATCTMRI